MAMTPYSLWDELCALYGKYYDKSITVPNFKRSVDYKSWEVTSPIYTSYRHFNPEEIRALFEARDPTILDFHRLITKARLIGIEVQGWP